jgi:hypothetical protein
VREPAFISAAVRRNGSQMKSEEQTDCTKVREQAFVSAAVRRNGRSDE